jgi:HlyD family secretion protein
VTSNTDLNLSFKSAGIVRRISIKVGDKVKSGQLLANLDQKDQLAALTSARGSLAAANANYQKVVDGSSSEEVAVAQVGLDNAKSQQNLLVDNAYRTYLNSTLEAIPDTGNTSTFIPTVTGTYTGTQEGTYKVTRTYGSTFSVAGLESISKTNYDPYLPTPLGTKGLYLTFASSEHVPTGNEWVVEIPNRRASDYVTNFNAWQSALKNRDATIAAAQANLDLAKAMARPADLEAARAQILSAQGSVLSAQAAVEATEIRAPSDGTVTKIDVKVGEVASSLTPVVVLQDVGNLYLEADVSEANIAEVKIGQTVEVTFDALSSDNKYVATVSSVDPASTVVSGVVNYRVKALLDRVEEIKPGMTANMSILTGEKANVLAVPVRAVLAHDGKKYVRVVTDPKTKAFQEQEVATGFEADGGLVEITSGISAGQEIVTFIDSK